MVFQRKTEKKFEQQEPPGKLTYYVPHNGEIQVFFDKVEAITFAKYVGSKVFDEVDEIFN